MDTKSKQELQAALNASFEDKKFLIASGDLDKEWLNDPHVLTTDAGMVEVLLAISSLVVHFVCANYEHNGKDIDCDCDRMEFAKYVFGDARVQQFIDVSRVCNEAHGLTISEYFGTGEVFGGPYMTEHNSFSSVDWDENYSKPNKGV